MQGGGGLVLEVPPPTPPPPHPHTNPLPKLTGITSTVRLEDASRRWRGKAQDMVASGQGGQVCGHALHGVVYNRLDLLWRDRPMWHPCDGVHHEGHETHTVRRLARTLQNKGNIRC